MNPTLAPLAGVAGEDGMEAQLWLLWLALELDRVGEAAREDGFDLRPRDRKGVMPWEAPSGKMNFSRSSRLVRPRAGRGHKERRHEVCVNPLWTPGLRRLRWLERMSLWCLPKPTSEGEWTQRHPDSLALP